MPHQLVKCSFFPRTVSDWNKLSEAVQLKPSVESSPSGAAQATDSPRCWWPWHPSSRNEIVMKIIEVHTRRFKWTIFECANLTDLTEITIDFKNLVISVSKRSLLVLEILMKINKVCGQLFLWTKFAMSIFAWNQDDFYLTHRRPG